MDIIVDKVVISGYYFARGRQFCWTIKVDSAEEWVLETDDWMTDCCSDWGMEKSFFGESYEECMEHLKEQVQMAKGVAI